jgi:hypothetical protein
MKKVALVEDLDPKSVERFAQADSRAPTLNRAPVNSISRRDGILARRGG